MLSEWRGIEYVLEILKVLNKHEGRHDSKKISDLVKAGNKIEVNLSYLQKVLQRMSRINLVVAASGGYQLSRPLNEITVTHVLDFCAAPDEKSPASTLVKHLKEAVSLTGIDEFYEFD
jgi:DNA-binding IscR family transcriptional regulator